MLLSYRYRIYPNKAQEDALSQMLGDFCQLYNAALEHRINTFRHGVGIRCYDQINTLPEIRRDLEHQRRWSYTAQQQVLRKLDKAYSAFFGRIKKGIKAGFPRFKPRDRYSAADFRVGDGLTLKKSGKIGFIGVPNEVKVKWHRALPSKPKSAILCRNAGQWHIIFHVEIAATERSSTDSIGVDLGLTALMALSNGEKIARPNFTKRSAAKLRRAQRALARCKRGSNIRKKRKLALAKFQSGIANSRKHFLHQESRKLVSRFGRIAFETLNVKGLASGMLAKHVNDASWNVLTSMVRYKAENAGVECIFVDPRGTSQTCPGCGAIAKKTLSVREHRCDCGIVIDRDVAAAMVVHFRAFSYWPEMGLETLSQRVAA